MRCYLNLTCILIQLLYLRCQDINPNSVYRKLLATTIRSKFLSISFSTKERSPVLSSVAFNEQFYFKTQTTTPIIDIHLVRTSNKPYNYGTKVDWDPHRSTQISSKLAEIIRTKREIDYCSYSGEKKCGISPRSWCCSEHAECGSTYVTCHSSNEYSSDNILATMFMFGVCILFWILVGICINTLDKADEPVRSNNLIMTNRFSAELLQSLNQHYRPSRLFETTQQYRETFNLRFIRRENVIRNVSLDYLTDTRQQQVLDNNNSDVRRTINSVRQQTSCFPPSYNDTMQQQSELPPSYNDFIRKGNKKKKLSYNLRF